MYFWALLIELAKASPVHGEPTLTASAHCEPLVGQGRVRCDLEVSSTTKQISWADVTIKSAPAFVQPLRGRLAPNDAAVKGERLYRWEFGFAAKSIGTGETTLLVRTVLCDQGTACVPGTVEVTATIVVR